MLLHKFLKSMMDQVLGGSVIIKAALLTDDYVFTGEEAFFSEVSGSEISATGYTAGGQQLSGKFITDTGSLTKLTAVNPSWTIAGAVNFRYVVFYIDSGTPSTSRIITIYQFPIVRTVINSDIVLELPAEGIVVLQ